MARALCATGIILIFCAVVLSVFTAISLPYLSGLDFARTQFNDGTVIISDSQNSGITELRFGVWAPCFYDQHGDQTCYARGYGYKVSISNDEKTANVIIGPSWTQGLAAHPVAAIVAVLALIFSFFQQQQVVALIASILAWLAAALTLVAFFIDIALFAYLKHQVNNLPDIQGTTNPGPGFWLTFASLILLTLGGLSVFFNRRQNLESGGMAYPDSYGSEKKSKFASLMWWRKD